MKKTVKIFKALSDELRIRILKLLEEKNELCVADIMDILNISQSRASRNLGILRDAELIRDRRDGNCVFYSLEPKFKDFINNLVQIK